MVVLKQVSTASKIEGQRGQRDTERERKKEGGKSKELRACDSRLLLSLSLSLLLYSGQLSAKKRCRMPAMLAGHASPNQRGPESGARALTVAIRPAIVSSHHPTHASY